jgi:hypothetical protein
MDTKPKPKLKLKKRLSPGKLKAMAHYVIAGSDPARLGSIRLNKILWYVDTLHYRANGASMSGETYVKRQHGPVPEHVLRALGKLEEEDAIVIRKRSRFGLPMTDFIPMTDPDPKALTPEEMALIDEVREYICTEHTADSISQHSHDQIWEAANMGERIPLNASLAAVPGEPTAEMLTWATSVRSRYEAVKRAT